MSIWTPEPSITKYKKRWTDNISSTIKSWFENMKFTFGLLAVLFMFTIVAWAEDYEAIPNEDPSEDRRGFIGGGELFTYHLNDCSRQFCMKRTVLLVFYVVTTLSLSSLFRSNLQAWMLLWRSIKRRRCLLRGENQ